MERNLKQKAQRRKKTLKRQKGITLIALVITIIVMLILAGVSLSMTLGDNGILRQAQNAKTSYENASAIEQMQIATFNLFSENDIETVTAEQVQDILVNNEKMNVTVKKEKFFHDEFTDRYYVYDTNYINETDVTYIESSGGYCLCNEDAISKALNLEGIDKNNVKAENYFIISYNDKSDTYIMNGNGKVEKFLPFSNMYTVMTSKASSGNDSIRYGITSFVSKNYTFKDIGFIYGTNKLLGADTSITDYSKISMFSRDYLDKNLRFTDDSRSSAMQKCKFIKASTFLGKNKSFYKFDYSINAQYFDAYVGCRAYMAYEDNFTHETKLIYSEPIYATYNQIKALE